MSSPTLLWYKRDLRLEDHPALNRAAELGPVVPVYIVEPDYWALPDTSGRQWAFLRESLESLQRQLAHLGAPLVIRMGDVVEEFEKLRAETEATRLISHEETGNLWTFARDKRVAAWAREKGVAWEELPQSGVMRRLPSRNGWAKQRDGFMYQPQLSMPAALPPHGIDPGAIPDLDLPDTCPERQRGGRDQALSLLGGFLTERGQSYRSAMSSPLAGEWACSRLSPHLAIGTLSVREAAQAGRARKAEVKGTRTGWLGSMRSFEARLAWRDHFMQKLEDEPEIEARCLHHAYENLRPRESDASRLNAWETGQTGLPFVDACMRFCAATGWLNFRMRAMVTAVASYHLWLDWRSHGPRLARMFTDYEPGIHWSQVQMQSGTTGMNTVRIYNPVKQGTDQDPDGIFTRRWCPELAEVPDRYLQEPWLWEGAGSVLGRSYPEPTVDVKAAAKAAREAVWAVRKGDAFRTEAARIVDKHASRKDPRFVNDRQPRPRRAKRTKPPKDQLSFDL
ncbi:MAG: deoxyribodipyrimidine photo-lyase [Litoreibacter sp.]|nr:deoxyribodipyrimidine photo-lyase [Litoreibacter sp.]